MTGSPEATLKMIREKSEKIPSSACERRKTYDLEKLQISLKICYLRTILKKLQTLQKLQKIANVVNIVINNYSPKAK